VLQRSISDKIRTGIRIIGVHFQWHGDGSRVEIETPTVEIYQCPGRTRVGSVRPTSAEDARAARFQRLRRSWCSMDLPDCLGHSWSQIALTCPIPGPVPGTLVLSNTNV
jgi:hypothetical protein